jgi:SAM-dependent methyltransferase
MADKTTSPAAEPLASNPVASPPIKPEPADEPLTTIEAASPPTSVAGPHDYEDNDSKSLLSTQSLTPSILEYRKLHGRTYANVHTTEYWGPNDERQNEGLDLIHNALTQLLNDQLFLAPINRVAPGRVLDIGTGSGIWAMDFADEFPSAEVIATDLSPVQPTWVPNNLTFEIDDCLLEWTWPENHFDFVHIRLLYGCVPDWADLNAKVLRHLKPGGWFEHVEIGCQGKSDVVDLPADHVFNTWAKSFYAGGEKMGKPFDIAEGNKMRDWMIEAGFAEVTEKKFRLPVNDWVAEGRLKMAGVMFHTALDRDMEGFSLFLLTQLLGWSRDEVLILVAKMRAALRRKQDCPYITV